MEELAGGGRGGGVLFIQPLPAQSSPLRKGPPAPGGTATHTHLGMS